MGRVVRVCGDLGDVRAFIGGLYGPDLHAKRVDALAGATLGVMTGASLAVAMIGQALAQARGLVTKHAVKQVDRLMSNAGIDVWDSFARRSDFERRRSSAESWFLVDRSWRLGPVSGLRSQSNADQCAPAHPDHEYKPGRSDVRPGAGRIGRRIFRPCLRAGKCHYQAGGCGQREMAGRCGNLQGPRERNPSDGKRLRTCRPRESARVMS